ncbi:MAG TPA: branched-chain amino acid ABC transporter permease [Acidimicrobiales bacterium]|nr:branched-chain amino acid ABC transporter permease [Acidimicrobiales bacterium]
MTGVVAQTEADLLEAAKAEAHKDEGFSPSPGGWVGRGALYAFAAVVVLVVPAMREAFEVNIYTQAVVFAIIGLSLNVLLGYVGQISLGHQAFVGIGAFTSAYMVSVQGQSFFVAVAVAMVVGALQALVLGAVSLRIKGLYFALITLSYGLVAEQSIFQIQSLTGGGAGQAAPKPSAFSTDLRYYYLCLAFLGAVIWVDHRMMRTKGGRALLALRENPRVASTFGVNVKVFTLFAFTVSGVFAGLGGALLAHNDTFVVADIYNFRLALVFVIMTVVGGLRSRTGVIVGSAFFALLGFFIEKFHIIEVALSKLPKPLTPQIAPLVVGPLLLLLTLTLYPGGIGQQVRPLLRWLGGHRFDIHDRGEKEVQISDVRA